jgi:tetratricopeptide (TPR) repeat protein
MQEGRWAEAAEHWTVLCLLRPDQTAYARSLADAQSRASHAAAEYLHQAQQARDEGQTDRAAVFYLKALSADPGNSDAAQALRDIEQTRARKAYFGPSARGGTDAAASARRGSKSVPSATERRELDSAIMLLHQGDAAAAIQTLETYLRKYPNDELGRRTLQDALVELAQQRIQQGKREEALAYLEKAYGMRDKGTPELSRTIKSLRKEIAEDYYQQGLRAQPTNLDEAIRLWEKCLKYDPDHAQAARRLERARRMEQNLRSIEGSNRTP